MTTRESPLQASPHEAHHASAEELEAGLDHVRDAPRTDGVLELIVARPGVGERRELGEAVLDLGDGLVGDNWLARGNPKRADGSAHPDMQLNVMSARAVHLVARSKDRWQLAGDQLYVDLDLSEENLPAGTRLTIGEAVIEVTAEPHLGCKKFFERFGMPAMRLVNSELGRGLRLRGLNARVVEPGTVRAGDRVTKLA